MSTIYTGLEALELLFPNYTPVWSEANIIERHQIEVPIDDIIERDEILRESLETLAGDIGLPYLNLLFDMN